MSAYQIFDKIYLALDTGDYETAKKLCQNSTVSKLPLAKTLLAYSYASLRQGAKGLELAKEVLATKPTEEGVLNALGCTFKMLKAEKEFCECYENALKLRDLPENYVNDLFNSYSRQEDPKKMQQLAQRMYKSSNKPKYLLSSVACLLHQNDLSPTMLMVAQKTLQKYLYEISSSNQPGAEEISLYMRILLQQKNPTQALTSFQELTSRISKETLDDDVHFKANVNLVRMQDLQMKMHKIDLLYRLHRIKSIVMECRELLKSYPDQWNIHVLFIDCLVNLYGEKSDGSNNKDNNKIKLSNINSNAAGESNTAIYPPQSFDVSNITATNEDNIILDYTNNNNSNNNSNDSSNNTISIEYTSHNYVILHREYLIQEFQSKKETSRMRGPYLAELTLLLQWFNHRSHSDSSDSNSSSNGLFALPEGWKNIDFDFSSSSNSNNEWSEIQSKYPLIYELTGLILRYITMFHTKHCCFGDLKPYLYSLYELAILAYNNSNTNDSGSDKNATVHVTVFLVIQQWCEQRKLQVRHDVLNAVSKITGKPIQSIIKTTESTSTATAITNEDTKQVDKTQQDQLDEGGDDNEDDEDNTGATTKEEAAGEKKKKKKHKKKKKTTATDSSNINNNSNNNDGKTKAAVANSAELLTVVGENSDVLLFLCSYCKYDQIIDYCNTLLSLSSNNTTTANNNVIGDSTAVLSSRLSLYEDTKVIFANGVGGEKRNVQPGDELLLLNSTDYRNQYIKQYNVAAVNTQASNNNNQSSSSSSSSSSLTTHSTSSSTNDSNVISSNELLIALHWMSSMLYGIECSPYSFGFKLDILDVYRELGGCGNIAYATFTGKPRNIQMDTMSYLILPHLIESGCYEEAIKQHRAVLSCHVACKRETLEMIGKSFEFGNYSKGLELKAFIEQCKRSTQLAVSRAEVPLLELTEGYYQTAEALKYLKDVIEGEIPESHREMSLQDMSDTLIDQMDYNILIRTDIINEQESTQYALLRRKQLEYRILQSQYTLRLIYSILQHKDYASCMNYLQSTVQSLNLNVVDSNNNSNNKYLQWNQSLLVDKSREIERLINNMIKHTTYIGIHYLFSTQNTTTANTSVVLDGFDDVTMISAIQSIFHLRTQLIDNTNIRYMTRDSSNNNNSNNSSSNALLSPDWIRSVSYLIRTHSSIFSLLLQTLLKLLPFTRMKPPVSKEEDVITNTVTDASTTNNSNAATTSDQKNNKKSKSKNKKSKGGNNASKADDNNNDVTNIDNDEVDMDQIVNKLVSSSITSSDSANILQIHKEFAVLDRSGYHTVQDCELKITAIYAQHGLEFNPRQSISNNSNNVVIAGEYVKLLALLYIDLLDDLRQVILNEMRQKKIASQLAQVLLPNVNNNENLQKEKQKLIVALEQLFQSQYTSCERFIGQLKNKIHAIQQALV